MTTKHRPLIILSLVAAILLLVASCSETPTTITVYVRYDDNVTGVAPINSVLYLRMLQTDGTMVWSNDAAPMAITNLQDEDLFRFVLTPSDTILTDPADLYIIDAYFYSAAPVGVPPGNINPESGGDAERFTYGAIPDVSYPGAGHPYFYSPAPHLEAGVQILSGTLRQVNLVSYHDFP